MSMNAMSVSPVKPSLNAGNHTVPVTATNLTKQSIPTANNFTPLNLIPEAKPASVPISASPEKSIDLCSKPHTSNGTVYSIAETNSNTCPTNPSKCVENCETAENLSTNSSQKFSDSTPVLVETKTINDIDDKKTEPKKMNVQSIDNKELEKGTPAQIESHKEIQSTVTNIPKEEMKEAVAVAPSDSTVNNEISPTKKEIITETAKVDPPKKEVSSIVSESIEITESKTETSPRATISKTTKRKAKPPVEPVEEESTDGRKSKRVRLPTQPYQSPIPELQLIAKLNAPTKSTPKNSTERIIAFYKNEFLAVRNPEGSFYICQTFQNIHKSSTKIKIRWFTHLPQDVFTPDFYDTTEFDCILTNVTMTRMEKDRWKLSDQERTRIENILKRALDVEKGVADQLSVTEEHPDGLDLSLFKDEAQLKKKKKKSLSPKTKKAKASDTKKSKLADASKSEKSSISTTLQSTPKKSSRVSHSNQSAKVSPDKTKATENKAKKDKKNKRKTGKKSSSAPKPVEKTNSKVWEPSVKASNSSRVVLSLKKEDKPKSSELKSPKRMSSVSLKASSTAMTSLPPQKRRKEDVKSLAANNQVGAERAGKVRNAGSAVTAKINSAAMRTTKEKERKTASSNQRKK